jgi:hypothetical protein
MASSMFAVSGSVTWRGSVVWSSAHLSMATLAADQAKLDASLGT